MVTIIIFMVIAIVMMTYDSYGPFIGDVLLGAIIGSIIGLCVAFALPAQSELITTERQIVSLQDGSGISGSFSIGTGSIDSEMCFTFYTRKADAYVLEQIPAKHTSVFYCDTPRVVCYQMVETDAFINHFAFDAPPAKEYLLYVPKGTIDHTFTLNTQ